MKTPAFPILVLVAALMLPGLAGADETRQLHTRIDRGGSEAADLDIQEGTLRLSLDDAITLALRRNLSLVVERYRHQQSIWGIQEALGMYDFELDGTVSHEQSSAPVSSILTAAATDEQDTTRANFNISRLVPWGGTASAAFNNSRIASSDQNNIQNPAFSILAGFNFTQPLLRNFGRAVTERNLLVSRTNTAISRETFRGQVEGVVRDVTNAYWTLVEAQEQLKVAEESLSLAKDLHEMNRIQVEVGTMAPLEMVQSEATVATREEEIIRRRAAVEDAADELRRLANLDRGDLWDVVIEPVTDPEIERLPVDFEAAVSTAFAKRADVLSQRLRIDNLAVDSKVAKNQKRPRLDLTAELGYSARDGDTLIYDPVTERPIEGPDGEFLRVSRGYSDALDQILNRDFDTWSVQLQFAYPLQNRTAKARSVKADLALEQGQVELENLEEQVFTEVRRSARAVQTAAQQIESARVSSKLARKNLEAEQKRYENGLSTSFKVLEIQEDLSQALSREVSSVVGYRRALVDLYRSTGELLEKTDIELVDDAAEAH